MQQPNITEERSIKV